MIKAFLDTNLFQYGKNRGGDVINTTDTSKYPAGTGIGSIRKISAWTALSQVKGLSASGGDMQFANVTAIDDVVAKAKSMK